MEGFEEFDQYHSRSVKTIFVTVQRRGNFSLNRSAFKALGEPPAVKLLFNRSTRQIGFRPATSNDFRSVPVRKQGQSDSYLIAGLTFCKEYDIDTTTARRYEGKMQEGILIVDLKASSTDATGPRMRNDLNEELKGKQERRLAQRIGEKKLNPSNETPLPVNLSSQVDQNRTIAEKAKDVLSREDRNTLENALRGDKVDNLHDILRLLGYVENK
jgi:hypothetical protein